MPSLPVKGVRRVAIGTSFWNRERAGRRQASPFAVDLGGAALGALVLMAIYAASGFSSLADANGDNDSLLRLVEVRDLLAGQGWFDLHQYRMGPEGGFVMHWSRFVDGPLALLVLIGGETAALVLWPLLLAFAALLAILRMARRLGGEEAVLPALVLGMLALYFVGIFAPGAIDHHNIQLVLTLAVMAGLVAGLERPLFAAGAGVASAAMLAVGMETAPYVALAGLCAVVPFWLGMAGARASAFAFSAAFAGAGLIAFLATVAPSQWGAAQCDAYSLPQMSIAIAGGGGLALLASIGALERSLAMRSAALAGLAVLVAGIVVVFFPQCLAAPYAGVDPELRALWLDYIIEAQPLWRIVAEKPAMVTGYYVTPLIGLACVVPLLRGEGRVRFAAAIAGAFLLASVLVSVWQVRGSMFSIPIATIPLAVWVAFWRRRATGGKVPVATTLSMLGAWLVSLNVLWALSANMVADAVAAPGKVAAEEAGGSECYAGADYGVLAEMPGERVLAVSNLGSAILRYSTATVLSGPYHRNVEGNLTALRALMAPPSEAREAIARERVTVVAVCAKNPESELLAKRAPQGLLAGLMKAEVPDWLEPVAASAGQPLELFRVRPGG